MSMHLYAVIFAENQIHHAEHFEFLSITESESENCLHKGFAVAGTIVLQCKEIKPAN